MISHDSDGLRFEMIACTKEDVLAFPPMSLVRICEGEREVEGRVEGRVEVITQSLSILIDSELTWVLSMVV